MSALTDIYDIERVVETALKQVLTDNNIKAFTYHDAGAIDTDGNPAIDFTLQRPRVEILMSLGEGATQWKRVNGVHVQTSWQAALNIMVITEPNMTLHSDYRATVRGLMHQMFRFINGPTIMPRHKVHDFSLDGGTTPQLNFQDGYMLSTLIFNIKVSVQDDAWAAIAA